MDLKQLLQITIDRNASDLHLIAGHYPAVRINGELIQLPTFPLILGSLVGDIIIPILNEKQRDNFALNRELDFGYDYSGHRFRVNLYYSRGYASASFRSIPNEIKGIDELGLLPILHSFSDMRQGFILVTGPTGHGKSTTIAAIINEINQHHAKHILTIEDPVEYVYPKARSMISQREIGQDTYSWNSALKGALREDPDVVLIGEMRDYDTVAAALTIAETGHLVFSTLHTNSAAETLNRIVDIFPPHQQNQIKVQLSTALKAIVSQRLIPNMAGAERLVACEILINNHAISSLIRESKTHLIDSIVETSAAEGMALMEKHLYSLYMQKKISRETALYYAIRPAQMKKMIE